MSNIELCGLTRLVDLISLSFLTATESLSPTTLAVSGRLIIVVDDFFECRSC